jgi:uncharacterized protein
MSIEETLRKELTAAIRAKDLKTANVIRMISTKVMERRTSKGFQGSVDDDLYREVIAAYAKSLKKAQEQYEAAGERGAEQVAELQFEIEYCQRYLPTLLGEDQLREVVRAAIAETGADSVKMVGKVIGQVMKTHKGQAEAADVKRIASEELSKRP